MRQLFIVGLGGFIGSAARYKLGVWVLQQSTGWRFPLSTFAINISGCFLIGVLAGVAERQATISPDLRLFLFTGLLGGYTTFSAFGFEGFFLFRRGEIVTALSYALLSVAVGLLAVWLGFKVFAPAAVQH